MRTRCRDFRDRGQWSTRKHDRERFRGRDLGPTRHAARANCGTFRFPIRFLRVLKSLNNRVASTSRISRFGLRILETPACVCLTYARRSDRLEGKTVGSWDHPRGIRRRACFIHACARAGSAKKLTWDVSRACPANRVLSYSPQMRVVATRGALYSRKGTIFRRRRKLKSSKWPTLTTVGVRDGRESKGNHRSRNRAEGTQNDNRGQIVNSFRNSSAQSNIKFGFSFQLENTAGAKTGSFLSITSVSPSTSIFSLRSPLPSLITFFPSLATYM